MHLYEAFLNRYAEWVPLFIFLSRIADVSIGTIRMIFVVRGARLIAPLLGFLEVTIWLFAVTTVVKRLDHAANILAYAAGFASGNWVGMWLEHKLALGHQLVRLISRERGHSIAHALRLAGFSVTELQGRGGSGPVIMSFVVAPRRRVPHVARLARATDPEVFLTIEDTRQTPRTLFGNVPYEKTGWRAIVKKK